MSFITVPLTLKEANEFVTTHHRHNKKCQGHRFSIGCIKDNDMVGVAICGRPLSRRLDSQFVLEVLRVCIKDPAPKNACSYLYARAWKIWQSMGGNKILTYTLASESGASMRAVGWDKVSETKPLSKNAKGWETRDNRQTQPVNFQLKFRWEKELTV
jgi:hypothetical protein|tara:strand:+ start:48 stop:518 length:471 start_codon:yes stop_codon:yes gene_type:complete